LGDLTLDIVVRSDHATVVGSDVSATVSFRAGGSAANTARAFAGLGGRAVFIGAVGRDALAGRLLAALRAESVTPKVARLRGSSARLVVLVSADGERSFLTDRGVADGVTPRLLREAWLRRVDGLHVPAYSLLRSPLSEAALKAVSEVRSAGGLVSVDLASRAPLLARGRRTAQGLMLGVAPDVLFGNADEAEALAGSLEPGMLARFAPIVVVKQGAAGCQVIRRAGSGEERREVVRSIVATRPLAVADTTGAGDAFDAGFLYSLLSGGYRGGAATVSDAVLRRAALAGHRAATRLLTSRRKELTL
jgi:sugar/nucleoside kinase (ribokinase family)